MAARNHKPLADRFWANVEKTDGCWNWKAPLLWSGYGRIQDKGRMILAHRASWIIHHGREPEKLVLHKCDNRKCVRPDHLWEGDHRDNIRDCVQKSRNPIAAAYLARTHCKNGHEFTPENTRTTRGYRVCRACGRERERIRKYGTINIAGICEQPSRLHENRAKGAH